MKRKLTHITLTAIIAAVGLFLCGSRPLNNTCCSANSIEQTAQAIKEDFANNSNVKAQLNKVDSLWLIEISSNN